MWRMKDIFAGSPRAQMVSTFWKPFSFTCLFMASSFSWDSLFIRSFSAIS